MTADQKFAASAARALVWFDPNPCSALLTLASDTDRPVLARTAALDAANAAKCSGQDLHSVAVLFSDPEAQVRLGALRILATAVASEHSWAGEQIARAISLPVDGE